MLGFLDTERKLVEALAEEFPCILYNKEPKGVRLPCAKADHAAAGRLTAAFFADRNRKRVALVNKP